LRVSIIRIADQAKWARRQRDGNPEDTVQEAIDVITPDLIVRNGPFKGMKYPDNKSFGSMLFPKLLGSYEREIQPVLDEICAKNYTDIVDVGCAEGYYAIGLALRIPSAWVYAFDIDQRAIRFCQRMAHLNGVVDRVITGSFCDSKALLRIPFRGRGLIVSDCEGYEKELFSEEVIAALSEHDFLIEVHDFIDLEISTVLRKRFEKTHQITVMDSTDDIRKAQTYDYKELETYSLRQKRVLLAEKRPAIMQWYYLQSLRSMSQTS
jgi:hypothetical protein